MAKYIYMYQIFWMKMYKNQNVVFGLKSSTVFQNSILIYAQDFYVSR